MAKSKERSSTEHAPATWSPFRDLGRTWNLPRMLDEIFAERSPQAALWSPAIDVSENDDAYAVTVELPGARREDVSLEVQDNVLSIRGEKKSEREEKDEHRHWVERRYGSFSRTFALPANADAERVKAKFDGGVLTIEIPKREEAKPKQIAIKS